MKRARALVALLVALSVILFPQMAMADDSAEGARDVVVNANLKAQSEMYCNGQYGYPDVLPDFDRFDYWTTITLTNAEDPSVTFNQRIVWGPDATSQQAVFPDVPYGTYTFSFKHESTDPNGLYKDGFGIDYAGNKYYDGWIQSGCKLNVLPDGLQLTDNSRGRSRVVQELSCDFTYTFMGRFITITKNISVFPGSDMPTGEQTFTFSIKLDGEIPGLWGSDALTNWRYAYLTEYEETASITIDFDQYSSPDEIEPASVTVRVPAGMTIADWSGAAYTYQAGQEQSVSEDPASEALFMSDDPRMPAWAQFDWLIDEVEAPEGWNDCLPAGGDTLTMSAAPYIFGMMLASTGSDGSSEPEPLVAAVPNNYNIDTEADGNWVAGTIWKDVYTLEYDISLRNVYSANVVLPECSREVFEPVEPAPVTFDKAFVAAEGCALPDEACTFTFELDGYRNRLETDTSLVDTFVHLTQTVEYQPGDTLATVTFEDVPAGRYTLVEVDVPEGWESDLDDSEGVLVNVAQDGTVTFEKPGTPIDELGEGETEFTVTNTSSYAPPEEHETPDEPEEPEEPEETETPDEPVTPKKPTTPTKGKPLPKTGDASSASVLFALALSGAVLVAAGRRLRTES